MAKRCGRKRARWANSQCQIRAAIIEARSRASDPRVRSHPRPIGRSATSSVGRWDGPRVSELDFNQKLEMRRAFWAMGASTRIDVKLSALVKADSKNRTGSEDWTDL